MKLRLPVAAIVSGSLFIAVACGSASGPSSTTAAATSATPLASASATPNTSAAGLPAMYGQFYGTRTSLDGAFVVLRATSVPDHASPYFGQGNAGYEAPQAGMQVNPNRITS